MGIGIVYSRKNTPATLLKRGVIIFCIGYILNLFRGVMPNGFQYFVLGTNASIELAVDNLIYVDIFQFSGLAMIFFSFVKKVKMNSVVLVLFMILFAGLNYYLSDVFVTSIITKALTGLIWGSNEFSFFPFLTWIFYPIVGYLFGGMLLRVQSKNKFYGVVLSINTALVALILAGIYYMDYSNLLISESAYYHHQIIENILATCFVFAWISIIYYLRKVFEVLGGKALIRWSNNVSEIYFIHWIFIGWFVQFFGYNTLSEPYFYVLVVLIFMMSDIAADYYLIRKSKREQK